MATFNTNTKLKRKPHRSKPTYDAGVFVLYLNVQVTSCSNSGGTVNFGLGEKTDLTEASSRGLFADLPGVTDVEGVAEVDAMAGVDVADIASLAVGIGKKNVLGCNTV